jgi:hypothetical protein
MIRKTLLAIATAGTLAIGLGGAAQTASANHVQFHLFFGNGFGHGPFYGHRHHHCHVDRVKVWNKKHTKRIWIKKRICHWHSHGSHHHW